MVDHERIARRALQIAEELRQAEPPNTDFADGWQQRYLDRQEARLERALEMARDEQPTRYDVLYEYAKRNGLDYNELCRVVRDAGVTSRTSIGDTPAPQSTEGALGVPERVGPEGWKRLAESLRALGETDDRIKELAQRYGLDADGVKGRDGQTFSGNTPMVSGDSEANKEKG